MQTFNLIFFSKKKKHLKENCISLIGIYKIQRNTLHS